jgi:hypothetical protein
MLAVPDPPCSSCTRHAVPPDLGGRGERQFGRILRTPRRDGWRIDVRPFGEIYSLAGVGFRERQQAEFVLGAIRV